MTHSFAANGSTVDPQAQSFWAGGVQSTALLANLLPVVLVKIENGELALHSFTGFILFGLSTFRPHEARDKRQVPH